jgi:co-chaperonin GroES (HSP10)
MINRIPQNAVLVELEKLADDEYQLASGVKIYMDTSFRPEHRQRIYGKCVAIPDALTKDGGMIRYTEGDFKFMDSIVPEVQIGDTVYFNYTVVNRFNLVEYEGKSYYKVDYSSIICVVRDIPEGFAMDIDRLMDYCKETNQEFDDVVDQILGKGLKPPIYETLRPARRDIIPIAGNILCEEYYGKDATHVEVDGHKIHGEVSSSGLITKLIHKPSQKHGVVKITCTPLKGDDSVEVEVGDIILFPDKFGFKNNIEGTDYLVLKYWDIQAVVGNMNTESVV